MQLVDANILLRWLLDDHPEQSRQAEAIISKAAPSSLVVADIILAEVTYVLRGKSYIRAQIVEALNSVTDNPSFTYDNPELTRTIIAHYAETSLDFADCYLLARNQRQNTTVHTFDKQLAKKLA